MRLIYQGSLKTRLSDTQRLDKGNHMPAIIDGYRRFQGWLAAAGDTIADGLKKDPLECGLNFGTAQIGRQGFETLTDGPVTVMVISMALGAKC